MCCISNAYTRSQQIPLRLSWHNAYIFNALSYDLYYSKEGSLWVKGIFMVMLWKVREGDGVQTALPWISVSLTNMDQFGAHVNGDTEPFCLTFHLTFWINLLLQPWNQYKISMLSIENFRVLYSGSIRLNHTKLQIFKHFNLKNDNFCDLA